MGRVLAVDFGTRRIGLAVSDPLRVTGRGLGTYDSNGALDELRKFVQEEKVEIVVFGMPSRPTEEFARALEKFRTDLQTIIQPSEIVMQDEDFTSAEAVALLGLRGKEKQVAKARIDEMSALVILRDYLGLW